MNRVKKIVRYLLFFGILAVIFLGLSRVFYPKENSVEAGMPPRDVKVNGIFGAENNSLDVIFFGDSITFTSIKPMQDMGRAGDCVVCVRAVRSDYTGSV